MWRNWLSGSRDMYLTASTDDGQTFDSAQKLGTATWPLNGCPMDGGSLVVDRKGTPFTAWRRGTTIYTASPKTSETLLDRDCSQPCMAVSKTGIDIVYQSGGKLIFWGTAANCPLSKPEPGKYPSISAGGTNAVVVWETGDANSPFGAKTLP
jgi:hypothetical protein